MEDERDGLIINYRLPKDQDEHLSEVLVMLRGLLANRPIPDAGSLLVQMRVAREVS